MVIYYNLRVRVRKFSHQYSLLARLLSKLEQNEQLSHARLVHYLNRKLCLTIQAASQTNLIKLLREYVPSNTYESLSIIYQSVLFPII